jgi:1-acyl-sn-glycerol-3-phosphate acyltransferase
VGRFLARGLWNAEVRGKHHVPASGAAIVIANHVGLIDGPVLHGVIPRGSHFMVHEEQFTGVLGVLLRGAGQIRVEDNARGALGTSLAVLRRGGVVGVFPEGTRGTGSAENVHGGAAWLALQSGAPLVPTALVGTRHTGESINVWPRPRRRMVIEFGEPFTIEAPEGLRGRARQQWAAEVIAAQLRDRIASTLATTDLSLPTDDTSRHGGNRKEKQ